MAPVKAPAATGYSAAETMSVQRKNAISSHESQTSRSENSISNDNHVLEEDLLSTIDKFLETLEQKLDTFEKYFTRASREVQKKDPYIKVTPLSGQSSADLASADAKKIIDHDDLQKFYESLKLMKSSVLTSTSSKLETLTAFFNENYNSLFASLHTLSASHKPPAAAFIKHSSSALHNQLLAGLNHLEAKLNQADQFIGNFQPKFNIDYLNYYNYEQALKYGRTKTLHYYQLPFLWRENRFIIQGYRFYLSRSSLLKSIFAVPFHNETTNIWSHLLGSILVLYLSFFHFPFTNAYARNTDARWFDNISIYLFLFASFNCLICSTFWHTFTGTADMFFRNRCVCLDYTGITVLISASIISAQYCSLYYYPKVQISFIAITCVLSALGFFLNWSPHFDRPESRPLRVLFFVLLACSGITCFFVLWFYQGFVHSFKYFSPLLASFGFYAAGVVFYSLLIPERWRSDVILDEKLPDTNCLYQSISEEIITTKIDMTVDVAATNSGTGIIGKSTEDKENYDNNVADNEEGSCGGSCENLIDKRFLDKHFLDEPQKTANYGKFFSLWWVDYMCSSHTIWHFFVLCGILGHYWGILQMFAQIEINNPVN